MHNVTRSHDRASPSAGGHRKRGPRNQALGRSRGGLTAKIHLAADTYGRPLRVILSAGQAGNAPRAPDLTVQQRLVSRDEGRLLALVGPRRQAFRAPVFETQAMQQLQAAGMAVDDAPPRRDIGGHLATVPAEPVPQVCRKLGLLFTAQMPASAMPVERRQFIQATRSVVRRQQKLLAPVVRSEILHTTIII